MSVKPSIVTDFDSRRALFHAVIDALPVSLPRDAWDLKWGEPFIALSKDKKIWVRIFYQDALPITENRLKGEVERLRPHLTENGQLILCLPEAWDRQLKENFLPDGGAVRVWSYAPALNGDVSMREIPLRVLGELELCHSAVIRPDCELDEKLSTEEVRGLTELGVELKRYSLRKAG